MFIYILNFNLMLYCSRGRQKNYFALNLSLRIIIRTAYFQKKIHQYQFGLYLSCIIPIKIDFEIRRKLTDFVEDTSITGSY